MSSPPSGDAVPRLIRACGSAGEDLGTIRGRILRAVNAVVPFDAAFLAGADPETLLFTSVFADEPLSASAPLFLENEFGASPDVNRFADLARCGDPVASLDTATGGDRSASARWREIMDPLGMGDELRVVLRVDRTTWGYLCLHRSGSAGFDEREMAALRTVAPHLAEAFRGAAVAATDAPPGTSEAVILVSDHIVVAVGGAVEDIAAGAVAVGAPLPLPLAAVVRRLEAIEDEGGADLPPPTIRITTANGVLVAVHAARMRDASGSGPIVLTVAPAAPQERSSLLLAAYGLTPAQCRVAKLVLQGRTTGQIVVELRISANTVQDHLKAVFDKVGVRSRRELVGALMHSR